MNIQSNSTLNKGQTISIVLLSGVFFFWGLLTSLNSMLVPFLKETFTLSYTKSMLIQLSFYLAPFIVCIPSVSLMSKIGYAKVIQLSLGLLAIGCFLFYPAATYFSYSLFLIAIFILASGIGTLQLAANPFVISLGEQKTASSRLTFCSAMNSVGTTVASAIGMGIFMAALASHYEIAILSVQVPYSFIAICALALAILFKFLPETEPAKIKSSADDLLVTVNYQWKDLLSYPTFIFGAFTILCYVGTEVAVGTFIISYLTDENIVGMSASRAGIFVAIYWGGALVGRLFGSALLNIFDSRNMLKIHTIVACILVIIALLLPSMIGAWSLALIGLCNSIMYPVIFSLATEKLGALVAKGSAVLVMCGIGGALLPILQATLADHIGLIESFVIPLIAYVVIFIFGCYCKKYQIKMVMK